MDNYEQANAYAMGLANNLIKIELIEFFTYVHKQFYSEQDISFMEYFLELSKKEDEFVVHHDKLREYGVMTSEASGDVKKKFKSLGLVLNKDYVLGDVSQNSSKGGAPKKIYYLTTESFKLCLMRAQRRDGQAEDPVMYARYYLLLEKMFGLYRDYQVAYLEKLNSTKDDKIDRLQNDVRELLGYAKSTKEQLDEVQDDLTETKETVMITKSYLVEKSAVSTRNPRSKSKHHYFGATTYIKADGGQVVKFTTGTQDYTDKTMSTLVDKNEHTVIVKPFYHANGIDLRRNCQEVFATKRKELIDKLNKANAIATAKYNTNLKIEIIKHNKCHANKRAFSREKRLLSKVYVKDIAVKFDLTQFTYYSNPHMSLQDVVDIVVSTADSIHTSPVV